MKRPPRIAFIHATRLAIEPIEAAAAAFWPEAETISILEEGLSVDRAKAVELSQDLRRRIVELSRYAIAAQADGILFTCSAFGVAIEQAGREARIPVMKPNEAMFDAAFSYGDKITMICTFPPAAAGMEREFIEAAEARGSHAKLTSVFCEGAFDAKRSGDTARHDRLIAEAAAQIRDADVILLGQFSMAAAIDEVRQGTKLPVLTSPEAAIRAIRRRVDAAGAAGAC